jgi:hypothetical protein
MNINQRKKLLLDFKLDSNDFFVSTDQFGDKIIVKRSGIDKIERQVGMSFDILTMLQTPYKDRVCVTIYGVGRTKDHDIAKTTVTVNPDNCKFYNYAEVAEKRCRHRLLLKIAHLYEHNIYSDAESDEFFETRNQFQSAVSEVEKLLKV